MPDTPLAQRMRALDLSCEALAELVGVAPSTVYRWRGGMPPSVYHAQRVAAELGSTVEDLWPILEDQR